MRVPQAHTLNEVIERLDEIIRYAQVRGSRLGYFPALYKKVTIAVQDGIARGAFDDGPRMEELDVVFANRYIGAFDAWINGRPCTASWRLAFEAGQERHLIILQHLMLGMNAHINLDLGIAAAHTAPGQAIGGLKADFYRINLVLAALVEQVQDEIGSVSPAVRVLDRMAGRLDEHAAEQGLKLFRNLAWRHARRFAGTPAREQEAELLRLDRYVSLLGRKLRSPGRLAAIALRFTRLGEQADPAAVIRGLDHLPSPKPALLLPEGWEREMDS
jgi:hypothetical protein